LPWLCWCGLQTTYLKNHHMKETITFGSVCSGIEAASVAWNPLGWKAAWLSEIEPFPCAVLQHHYPDVPNLGDMTKIAHLIRDGFVPAPDVFCGGTPCQAFSVAGLRNSLDDARGNLSLIFCEIADEIDKRRTAIGLLPSVIFWENVPGVLSTSDNAFGCFLAGLAGEDDPLVPPGGKWTDAGCVYGPQRTVAWRVTDAQFFGVAQRRRRVFVVASAREGFDPAEVLFEFDGVRRDSPPSRETGQETAGTLASRTDGGGFPGTDEACSGYVQPVGGFQRPGVDLRNGALTGEVAHTVQAGQHAPDPGGTPHVLTPIAFNWNAQPDQMRFDPHVSASLTCSQQSAVAYKKPLPGESGNAYWQRMTDYEREHNIDPTAGAAPWPARSVVLRGREGGATAELGDEVAGCLRASTGGGDKPHVLAPVCVTGDITHTLKAEGFDASEDGTGRGQPIIGIDVSHALMAARGASCSLDPSMETFPHSGMAVRRLTPVECARLQGFPDDYLSQVIIRSKPAADGPMYKALGNSWAAPNVRWIGRRIDRHLRALSGAENETIIEKTTA